MKIQFSINKLSFFFFNSKDIIRFEENFLNLTRGATQETIEANTLPYKFGKNHSDNESENLEKCSICLYEFEESEDVRYDFNFALN